jgi:hypothetical protein
MKVRLRTASNQCLFVHSLHSEGYPKFQCDKVCQWLVTGRLFSPGTLVSSTNKTDRNNITEILLKYATVTFETTGKALQLTILELHYGSTLKGEKILLQSNEITLHCDRSVVFSRYSGFLHQ